MARAHDRGRLIRSAPLLLALLVPLLSSSLAPAGATTASTVIAVGAPYLGAPPITHPAVVAMAVARSGRGYYVLRADGTVSAYGAPYYGSFAAGAMANGVTATGIALDPVTGGYWIVCSNGVVRAFHAPYRGAPHIASGGWGQYPAAVAIASTATGSGYEVLRANGAVDGFGARTYGSLAPRLHYGATAPVVAVGIALDPVTGGYWIATSTGGVYGFHAPTLGSPLASSRGVFGGVATAGIASTSNGYDVALANGTVIAYRAAEHGGSTSITLPFGSAVSGVAVDSVTGGYYLSLDLTPLDGYYNPFRSVTSLVPQEVDQGVDYCGLGPVFAIGDGVVTNVYDAGWPSGVFISYRLSDGPAVGRAVYVAENLTPRVSVGVAVTPATVLGAVHDAKTCLETGWARPTGRAGYAMGFNQFDGRNSTAFGLNFNALLEDLGVRPGLPQPVGSPGTLPASWPRW